MGRTEMPLMVKLGADVRTTVGVSERYTLLYVRSCSKRLVVEKERYLRVTALHAIETVRLGRRCALA